MRRWTWARVLMVGALLGLVGSIGAWASATPAGAKALYAACTSVSGVDLSGQVITLGGCSGPTGGSGVLSGPLASPATITWAGGGTTTVSFTVKVAKGKKCAAGSTNLPLSGHATASTGPALGIRGMFFAGLCRDPNQNLSLVPGKSVLLQERPA